MRKNAVGQSDGNVYVVASLHMSEDSYDDVQTKCSVLNPDVIAVELDKKRYDILTESDFNTQSGSLTNLIPQYGELPLVGQLLCILLSGAQAESAENQESEPVGQGMFAGYKIAKEKDIPLALVDQDVSTMFNKFLSEVGTLELIKLILQFSLMYVLNSLGRTDVESNEDDAFDADHHTDSLEFHYPTYKQVFLDERNEYMANKTAKLATDHDTTVLIVGAAHKPGVVDILSKRDGVNVISESDFNELASQNEEQTVQ